MNPEFVSEGFPLKCQGKNRNNNISSGKEEEEEEEE